MRGLEATTGDKIIDTLSANGVTSENKTIHTPLHPLHSKLGCLVFPTDSSNSDTTLHGGGRGGKALFSPLKVTAKFQKGPLKQSVSTNFVVNLKVSTATNSVIRSKLYDLSDLSFSFSDNAL